MAKKKLDVIALVTWLVGIFVALAVGFGMVGGALTIPYIPSMVTVVAGWIVVGMTLLGAVMKLVK